MQENGKISNLKSKVITGIMLSVKAFNEKHRAVAGITTFLALFIILLLSIFFNIAAGIATVFTGIFGSGKKTLGIVLAALLLLVLALVIILKPFGGDKMAEQAAYESPEQIVETKEIAEEAQSSDSVGTEKDEKAELAHDQAKGSPVIKKEWDTSGVEQDSFTSDYPGAVGWVYFEDGHISYPIMQAEDNKKYVKLGYDGKESRTGAIFLDYRSSEDFSDSNSIVYGHNMKDGTMFGTLRAYRENPRYYDDHQYFQIITPTKAYRYLIFCYMDVSESYVLYDYVGKASYAFVKDAEPVRRKSYMDSEIPVNETKKVVTLSTCTAKDEKQFVVLGVMVDESDR